MSKSSLSSDWKASFDTSCYKSLRSYFGKVEEGQENIYDTPFAKSESTEAMLSGWIQILKSISTRWPTLYEFEIDLAKKVGPMSVMLPLDDRMDSIDSYYEGILLPSQALDGSAVSATVKEFSRSRGLEVRSQGKTVENMKKSTNSGSPYFTKRRNIVQTTTPCVVAMQEDVAMQYLNDGNFWRAPAILGWRGQEGGPKATDVKQRVVWMFPFAVNIVELQVYQPLIESFQSFESVPAWVSMDAVDRAITRLFDTKRDNDLVICTDFEKFDQHFNSSLQDASFQIISKILSPRNASQDWLDKVYPIKYMIPLAYDWDRIRYGKHGMGSGSGGTNCDETLAHRVLQYEVAISKGAKLNPNSQCLGDDGILSYPGITVEDVVETYSKHGLVMNADKQSASTQDCTYLRRWHHKDYRVKGICAGVYSTCRALGRLRYLERYHNPKYWDATAVALRQLSIIENVKYHPLKEEFVEYCMKRDKFRLGIDIPHFLSNIEEVAREKIENMPDLLGYTRTLQAGGDPLGGINQWWIVKYLQSKSK